MRFLKKLNLLDYIIFIAFFVTVFLAIYNLIPKKEGYCQMLIFAGSDAKLTDGDLCYDISGERSLGEISLEDGGFRVFFRGEKGSHGIESEDRVYAVNMSLEVYVGDYYLEGIVKEISCDMEKN